MDLNSELAWHVHTPRGHLAAACVFILDAVILAVTHGRGSTVHWRGAVRYTTPPGMMLDVNRCADVAREIRELAYGKT
jgi:hypothetical protein